MEQSSESEFGDLSQEATQIWDQLAGWWDDQIGKEGNHFLRTLVIPSVERLLDLRAKELVLEIGCGNGDMARRMAAAGARVDAFDASPTFLERAKGWSTENVDRIQYDLLDATDSEQLTSLGDRRYDAAVSKMVIMDLATINPLAAALSRCLKVGGRFVFAVSHPCFNSPLVQMVAERETQDGELVTVHSVKVDKYITPTVTSAIGIPGQPVSMYGFERPISVLFKTFFNQGFVLDDLEEPIYEDTAEGVERFSWRKYTEIPPALVARVRLVG